jgi:hypothetical protein
MPAGCGPVLLTLPAFAFSPWDHEAIATRALVLEGVDAPRFALAAAGEDWNLPRKWTRWHHYHSPDFDVHPLGRHPSHERVTTLDAQLRAANDAGQTTRVWQLAGFIAHHLADMASPPHVVPVAHGLNDAFEGWDFGPVIAAVTAEPAQSDWSPTSGQTALARATLAALDVPLMCEVGAVPWSRFWQARPGGFGTLGDLRFGRVGGCEAGTTAFVEARIAGAIAQTRALIRYVLAL